MEKIGINPQRITYLLKLFGLEIDDFLFLISGQLKTPLAKDVIFADEIKLSHLKRVDKIFKKGLSFYTSPAALEEKKEASIFFRKTNFNSELELGDREIVNKIEDKINSLSALAKLSGYKIERDLPYFSVPDNPKKVAEFVIDRIYPKNFYDKDRDFLQALIGRLADNNIVVYEFIETWNKKYKASLDGFFISPNSISIKRNQGAFKREIFTLVHELGHYLLDIEEIDNIKFTKQVNFIERWCDEFAFYFLICDDADKLKGLNVDDLTFDDEIIIDISQQKHVSRLAIFTHMAKENIISWGKYYQLRNDLDQSFMDINRRKRQEKEENKLLGIKTGGGIPKPILSPLEQNVYVAAFFEGVVDENELLTHFNKKLIEDVIYGQ